MIKVKNLVPTIYYNKSRDFQVLGRVFEVLYNYAKTGADLVLNSYEDIKMLDLLAKTLGFNSKHNYNTDDLVTLCNTFILILRNKGSKKSIEDAVTALLNAQHIESKFFVNDLYNESGVKEHSLEIYIPSDLTDLILLEDLFDYILPAGYTYRFIYAVFPDTVLKTGSYVESKTNQIKYSNNNISEVAYVESGNKYNIDRPTINTTTANHLGISYASVVFKSGE